MTTASGRERSGLGSVVLLVATLSGCGSALTMSSSDESQSERLRAVPGRAFGGGTNVSRVDALGATYESQSAAAVLGERVFIAYRAEDAEFTSYVAASSGEEDQRVCQGTSQLAVSSGNPSSGFERTRVPAPDGVAVLWGPVDVARFRDRVVASALASPGERFAALANDDGCLRTSAARGTTLPASVAASGALTAACLVPLTGGRASCVQKGGAVLEGGSLAATEQAVYAAYRDATHGSLALFRSTTGEDFAEVPAPAAQVDGDVLLAASASRLFLVYASGSELRLLRYDESLRGWEPPLVVAEDANRRHVPGRGERAALAVRGFTLGLLEGDPPELAIFWQRHVGSTARTTLRGALCETAPGGRCRWPRRLSISNARDHFLPSIVSVARRRSDGALEHRHLLSYWRGTRARNPRVGLELANIDAPRLRRQRLSASTQAPCAASHGGAADWGSADASFVLGQGSGAPVVYRVFTDSSSGACDARAYRASPQHVSIVELPAFPRALTPAR